MNELIRSAGPVVLLSLAALVTGCAASQPLRYYTLQTVPAAADIPPAAPAGTRARAVVMDSVQIPTELDRQEIVTHAGPYRVHISDDARWSAPLEDQIRRTLWDDLSARLPTGILLDGIAAADAQKHARLLIDVQEFYTDVDCRTLLRVSWAIRGPDGNQPTAGGSEEIRQPAPAVCASQADRAPEGMSRALGTLADRLAVAVSRWSEE